MKVLMIDPPSGWKYGFPKPLPDPKPEDVTSWLIENGYPQKEIDACGKHFYCRYWEQELTEEELKPKKKSKKVKKTNELFEDMILWQVLSQKR